jgi:hypothetical protein
MEELPFLFEQSPGLQQINLEFSEIESLDTILALLSQFTDLRELLLFGNRLETLPEDLSGLKTLEKLDISNNLIENIEVILPGLKSLPKLNELHITLQTENDEEILIKHLPKLTNLNGSTVDRSKFENENESYDSNVFSKEDDFGEDVGKTLLACESSGYFGEEATLSQEYLEKVATLYDQIRTIWQTEDKTVDKKLAEDFDEGIKSIMEDLSNILKQGHPDFLISVYSIKAKFELACICKRKISDLANRKSSQIGEYLYKTDKILEELFNDMISAMISIYPKIQKKINTIKSEAENTVSQSSDILEAAQQIEKESQMTKQEKEILIKRFQEERQELIDELEELKEENKKYLETIIRHSKTYADSVIGNKSIEEEKSFSVNNPSGSKTVGKILSLRQLKEVLEEIYVSKSKFDERCADGKMPKETMEQHMYTYLNTKYGLKNLILEWAASIIASVKKHSAKDNDVAVFGKILRNECDEEFRFVQIQVKETVAELLKRHLKEKYPLKTSGDIIEMINEKSNGFLYEEEWNDIVRYMYNEEDSMVLIDEITAVIKKKEHLNSIPMPKGKISREETLILKEKEKALKTRILYSDFLKTLLDFQLRGHEKFLNKFIQIFRKVDNDADGIINEQEFRKLIVFMDLGFSEDAIFRLLQVIDPYDNQQITFSESVALFSTEMVPVEGVAVMKKLSLES